MPSMPARAPRASTPRMLALMLALTVSTLAVACGDEEPAPGPTAARPADAPPPGPRPAGMVWIPDGTFLMGSDDPFARPDERVRLEVRLSGFWMDTTEVTNARFTEFTRTTGYVTRAEREGGADWRHPAGPDDDLDGRGSHPVVRVAYEDAVAFATWAGKRLPTEAEWESAARGGRPPRPFAWGDEITLDGRWMANVHQGPPPPADDGLDGFVGTSPVGRFEPDARGLLDMAGNVWEWTSDFYRADRRWAGPGPVRDPLGPESSIDPDAARAVRRVTKGGSFLSDASRDVDFRPSARRSTDPEAALVDTGFRCVMSQAMWDAWRAR